MIRNYFITALAVLRRRKIFTAISLFGISITITVMVVLAALYENAVQPGYPETNRKKSLYIFNLQEKNSRTGEIKKGSASFYFLNTYVSRLKTPEKIGIASLFSPVTTYRNNKKQALYLKYSNAAFFDIVKYHFTEGKAFSETQVQNQEAVAVISEATKELFFGNSTAAVGQYIEIGSDRYRVAGVIRNVPATMLYSYADVIVPHPFLTRHLNKEDHSYFGPFTAILMGQSESSLTAIKDEYNQLISRVPPESREYSQLFSHADTYLESFIRPVLGERNDFEHSGINTITAAAIVLGLLFMLLPAVNLINMNISRIMERSSEIAIRKAFGASRNSLTGQFLLENVIVCMLGGGLAFLFSAAILVVVNNSSLLPNTHLKMNFAVFAFSLAVSVIFGILSGVYPALRMSKLEIAEGLKVK